jgi:hypothetical protein
MSNGFMQTLELDLIEFAIDKPVDFCEDGMGRDYSGIYFK